MEQLALSVAAAAFRVSVFRGVKSVCNMYQNNNPPLNYCGVP